jgi:uracil-DNA glycosylase
MAGKSLQPELMAVIEAFLQSEKGRALQKYIESRRAEGIKVFPPDPFAAVRGLGDGEVNVVILGQDPYHGEGQANGLAFSVNRDCRFPPSLRNIFKEIHRSLGLPMPQSGDLSRWASQGVLLLNSVLTVEEASPRSHAGRGWEDLTAQLLEKTAGQKTPIAFLLWGRDAQLHESVIRAHSDAHLILCSNHPSPLSAMRGPAPFIGPDHFKTVNEWLVRQNRKPIDWS